MITPPRYLLLSLCLAAISAHAEVRVEIEPGDKALRENVEAHLSLASTPCDAQEWRVRQLFRRADKEIAPALKALGYYAPRIEKKLDLAGKCWLAVFRILPGEPVRVQQMDIDVQGEARDDAGFRRLLADPPLKTGDILHHGRYENTKDALQALAAQRGYLAARFTRHTMAVEPARKSARINIGFDSGPRYSLGELRINSLPIDDTLVRRLAGLTAGQAYEADAITRVDRNLSDSGYFSRVEVRALPEEAEAGLVPISAQLTPKPRHAWRAGVGFATDKGPRLTLGYDNRFLNRSGHRFDADLRVSPVETGVTGKYQVPGANPLRRHWEFSAGLRREDTDSAISDSLSLAARQTDRGETWTRLRFLELLYEESRVGADRTTATLLMPGIAYSRTTADDLLRTTRGYRARVEARAAQQGLGSTASFAQLRAAFKGIYSLPGKSRFTGRIDLGVTLADEFFELPASLRFFAGGDNSVRGYGYKRLGPLDANGDPEGGRHLLTGSLEYEHPVPGRDDWWGAIFVDAGNAFSGEVPNLKYGYGLGVRWHSPVGRIRADIAFPEDKSEDSWRLHVGMGVDL